MASSPFLLPAASAGAASDLQTKTTITINYPKRGTIITSSSVQISVSYLWEAYSYEPPSPTHKWGVSIYCRLYQSFDRSLDENDYAPFEYRGDVTSTSGSAGLNVNLANYPAGLYEVSASLLGPVYGSTKLGPWDSDESGFQYGYENPTMKASEEPAVTPGNQPQNNSGSNPLPIIAALLVLAGAAAAGARAVVRRGKKPPVKTPPKKAPGGTKTQPPAKTPPPGGGSRDLYQEWWNKASPAERQGWDSFEKFLSSRLGPARLTGYVDQYGRSSWASAYTSWQKEFNGGQTKASFEDWARMQGAGEQQSRDMMERGRRLNQQQSPEIAAAGAAYSQALRNKELFDKFENIRNSVSGDYKLLNFVDDARNSIVGTDGQVDAAKLAKLEGLMKNWIVRDKMGTETPDYTYSDAYYDTVKQASNSLIIRGGLAYLTAGYSEMAMNPLAAVSTMREGIQAGQSTLRAVAGGYARSGLELGIGESGRLAPYLKQQYNTYQLGQLNKDLASEVSTVSQLASQTEGQMTRSTFMKSSEVTQLGKSAGYELNSAEKAALELNNNPAYRQAMAENHELLPSNVKDVLGTAKQKAYEQARNDAVGDTLNQMGKDGVNLEGGDPFFIKQTGTHARPGNPGWNSAKSDFDHTVDFGSPEYNQLYEKNFNANLEGMGTSAKAIDANVYGAGTSSRGAYTGGATKYVQTYNEATGSDIMIRSKDGLVTVSREEPQGFTSLTSRMNPGDVPSAKTNFQNFFQKDMAKGGSLNSQIEGGSKTVSRMNQVNRVDNFQQTGKVSNFETPPAAKVADLIKNKGYTVDNAMQKVGYSGDKSQLLNDFKKIME